MKTDENRETHETVKVSVIIPIFNVESYLAECLDSIVKQVDSDVEIICVNDGSTDNSLDVLDSYSEKYSNIVIVNQCNAGAGAARNSGLDVAIGEYVMFVDSDDTIEHKTIYNLYDFAKRYDFDVVTFDMNITDAELKNKQKKNRNLHTTVLSNDLIMNDYCQNLCSACENFYKFEAINKYRFESIYYEDMALIPIVLSYTEKIGYFKYPVYNYRRSRPSSKTTETNKISALDMAKALESLYQGCNPKYINVVHSIVKYNIKSLALKSPNRKNKSISIYNQYVCRNNNLDECYEQIFAHVEHRANFCSYCDLSDMTNDVQVRELNKGNCNVYEIPLTQQALIMEKYEVIAEYFKMKSLYEHGGLCKVNTRCNRKMLIYAQAKNAIIGEILNTLSNENIISLKGEFKGNINVEVMLLNEFMNRDFPIHYYEKEQIIEGLKITCA